MLPWLLSEGAYKFAALPPIEKERVGAIQPVTE
jgi:hypothetical protein